MHEDARDTIVNRYVNGRMSPAEEEEFLRMAGNDPQLRHLVRAERIVRGSALRWRESIAGTAGDPPPALMARLAATAPGSAMPASETSPAPRTSIPGGRVARALMAILGIGGLAIGTFVVAPLLESPKAAPYVERTTSRGDGVSSAGAPDPGPARPGSSPQTLSAPVTPVTPTPEPHATVRPRSAATMTQPGHGNAASSLPDTSTRLRPAAAIPLQPAHRADDELPVIIRDSLQLRLNIDTSRR
jgi:hypothetical protein